MLNPSTFPSAAALLAFVVTMAACTTNSDLDISADEDVRLARKLIGDAAADGAVWLDTNMPPAPLVTEELGPLADSGIRGLDVPFTTSRTEAGDPRYRLVLRFVDETVLIDVEPCRAPREMPPPERQFLGLVAAFCEGRSRIATVAGPAGGSSPEEARRLVWRTTSRLFPDNYAETYGLRRLF